jgi:hypothetical protein
MQAPDGWLVRIEPPARTLDQSMKFWAMCSDAARSPLTWSDWKPDKMGWHDLFLAGWNVVKKRPYHLLIGLEGELVSLVPHSRSLGKPEMSELIDYTSAWCVMHGVPLKEE